MVAMGTTWAPPGHHMGTTCSPLGHHLGISDIEHMVAHGFICSVVWEAWFTQGSIANHMSPRTNRSIFQHMFGIREAWCTTVPIRWAAARNSKQMAETPSISA